MKYKLYTTSKKAWRAMIAEIKKAKKFVYIEMYIFLDDTSKHYDFFGALKERALSGVQVVIVADSFGSYALSNSAIRDLREHGIEVLFFSHWLRRTHRKITVIDGEVAFLGGVNIKKNSSNWLDLQIKLGSRLLIKNILRSFANTYKISGGQDKKILKLSKRSILKTIKIQFFEHLPYRNIYFLQHYYETKITLAQKRIVMVTPYLTPPRWLIALLDTAVKRGIRVEIFIPRDTDIKFLNRINRIYANQLSSLRINFYVQNKMNHAKLLIIDNGEALVGSQNLDVVSFYLNNESSVSIKDKKFIKDLNNIVDNWKKGSVKIPKTKKKLSFIDKIILVIIRLFFSVL
ncbi:MAG TPA: phosphatidylserine/phosphatidylglycerophosphate/cardiolipin synthase family protein [bacterium]|nr:phosphatidylserine/phosphatidylglycerophosphate/cardiolipin synthase family protein [bacterium]